MANNSTGLILGVGAAALLLMSGKKKKSGPKDKILDSGALPDGSAWRIIEVDRLILIDMKGPNSQKFAWLMQGSTTTFHNVADARAFISKLESGEMAYNPEDGSVYYT